MKTEVREKTISETIYIADDGTEFTTKDACRLHELRQELTPVYLVIASPACGGGVEVFSTRENAVESLKNVNVRASSHFRIKEVFLDERVLRDRGAIR